MSRKRTAFGLGVVILLLVVGTVAYSLRPPSAHPQTFHRASLVSDAALASAVASALPQVVNDGRQADGTMFPSGKVPSATWFASVKAGPWPTGVFGAQPVAGESLASIPSTPPAYYIVSLHVDGRRVGEFTLEPVGVNRLELGESDWSGTDSAAFDRASGIAEASFESGGSNEAWVSSGGFQAVIDWTGSQQVIVFTQAGNGSGDGSAASARLEQAAREIEPHKLYSGPRALALARMAFGTR